MPLPRATGMESPRGAQHQGHSEGSFSHSQATATGQGQVPFRAAEVAGERLLPGAGTQRGFRAKQTHGLPSKPKQAIERDKGYYWGCC